jgi:hypothetical protein
MSEVATTASVPRWAPVLLAVIGILPLWEACAVLFSGSMSSAHCNGHFAGAFCDLGLWIGSLIVHKPKAYLGYVALAGALGGWLVFAAVKLERRRARGE